MEQKLGLKSFYVSLQGETSVSVEQWLRSFDDAEYVITDSYHGLLFSIIFNKPFYLFMNQYRGNARFDSILEVFNITNNCPNIDWIKINQVLNNNKEIAYSYLCESIASNIGA